MLDWVLMAKLVSSVAGAVLTFLGLRYKYRQFAAERADRGRERALQDLKQEAIQQARATQKRLEQQQVAGLRAISYIYDLMEGLTKTSPQIADRVIIFNGHNGGSLPAPGKPYFISAVHSSNVKHLPTHRRPETRYKMIHVDSHYMRLLLQIADEGSVVVVTDEIRPSILQDYYVAEGVHCSVVFSLGFIGKTFVYGSVAREGQVFTDLEMIEVKRTINIMRSSFTKHIAIGVDDGQVEV